MLPTTQDKGGDESAAAWEETFVGSCRESQSWLWQEERRWSSFSRKKPRFNTWMKTVIHLSLYICSWGSVTGLNRKNLANNQLSHSEISRITFKLSLPLMNLILTLSHTARAKCILHTWFALQRRTGRIRAAFWGILMNRLGPWLTAKWLSPDLEAVWNQPVTHKGMVDPIASLSTSWCWL